MATSVRRYSANYGLAGRALHRLVFGMPWIQRMLAEIEDDLFAGRIAEVSSRREVFVAGMPRAGTTLLLELLHNTGEFASFTYRDMPFVLSPMLWARIGRAFAQDAAPAVRAHDDGMTVSIDSPEAFDEVIWQSFLHDRIVTARHLEPVPAERLSRELADGLRAAIRRLLALRSRAGELRYLSKNNANISRLPALASLFPECLVLVAFRDPATQAVSLARQHRRFLEMHRRDPFARLYMQWLGHFEFGANLRPINYRRWLDGPDVPALGSVAFWLRYWTETYRHALEQADSHVEFVDFDQLLATGPACLEAIADAVRLRQPASLIRQCARLRAASSRPLLPDRRDQRELDAACRIHRQLRERALQPRVPPALVRSAPATANSSRFF